MSHSSRVANGAMGKVVVDPVADVHRCTLLFRSSSKLEYRSMLITSSLSIVQESLSLRLQRDNLSIATIWHAIESLTEPKQSDESITCHHLILSVRTSLPNAKTKCRGLNLILFEEKKTKINVPMHESLLTFLQITIFSFKGSFPEHCSRSWKGYLFYVQTDRRENFSAHSIAMESGASGSSDETIISNLENEVAQHSSVTGTSRNDFFPGCFLAPGFLSGQNRRIPIGSYRFQKVPAGDRLENYRNCPKTSDRNPAAKNQSKTARKRSEAAKTGGIRHGNRRNQPAFWGSGNLHRT